MNTKTNIDLDTLRKLTVISLFTDNDFIDVFVLKGGNALSIAYGVNDRASMDLDFSMSEDFGMDIDIVNEKLSKALETTFAEEGFVTFDVKLYPTPGIVREEYESFWGGYTLEFKVISRDKYSTLKGDLEAIRKQAAVVDMQQGKKMKIDFSKHEYTDSKTEFDLDGFTVYVYTPIRGPVRKMRIYNDKHIFETIPPFLTTLRKFQWS